MKNNHILNGKPIHIIAEAGSNHNGNINYAYTLIDIATTAMATSIKFQIINVGGLYLPGHYKYGHYNIEDVIRFRKQCELNDDEYEKMYRYCCEKGIGFSASVFDEKSLNLIMKFNPPYIKIASCDLNNTRFLRKVAEKNKKVILSTGMASLKDVENAVRTLQKENFKDIVLMHCVSIYPCDLSLSNLSFIDELKRNFDFEIGFSDHTSGNIAACMVLEKEVTWIEKHFTFDKNLEGLDHKYAFSADELRDYVKTIDDAIDTLTIKTEKITEFEYYTRKRARRSLYAARDMKMGETILDGDVLIVRPENEMGADEIDIIVGKKLKKNIDKYNAFKRDFL